MNLVDYKLKSVLAYLHRDTVSIMKTNAFEKWNSEGDLVYQYPGEGVLPHMAYTGMCRWTEYGFLFWSLSPEQST